MSSVLFRHLQDVWTVSLLRGIRVQTYSVRAASGLSPPRWPHSYCYLETRTRAHFTTPSALLLLCYHHTTSEPLSIELQDVYGVLASVVDVTYAMAILVGLVRILVAWKILYERTGADACWLASLCRHLRYICREHRRMQRIVSDLLISHGGLLTLPATLKFNFSQRRDLHLQLYDIQHRLPELPSSQLRRSRPIVRGNVLLVVL